jgi:Tripartite tricarboxylate transporter TctB family
VSTPDVPADRPDPRQIPADLVAGLVMLGIAAVFRLKAGDERLDWIFPVTLSYVLGGLGLLLVIRGLTGRGDRVPAVPPILRQRSLRGQGVDVAVFLGLTVGYVVLLSTVGFWVMSALTIFVAAVYLDPVRSPRRLAIAAAVAIAVCIAAYLLLTRVFYVPFPAADWLPFL